jgi:hypothetical protein
VLLKKLAMAAIAAMPMLIIDSHHRRSIQKSESKCPTKAVGKSPPDRPAVHNI